MNANDQTPVPQGKATHGFHWPGQPSRADLVATRPKDGQNRGTTLRIRGMSVDTKDSRLPPDTKPLTSPRCIRT